jgi:hypothetical protein
VNVIAEDVEQCIIDDFIAMCLHGMKVHHV